MSTYLDRQTHCKRGHPLEEGNLIYRQGRRACATCHRDANRKADATRRRHGCDLPADRAARIPGERLQPLIDEYIAREGCLAGLPYQAQRIAYRARRGDSLSLVAVDRFLVTLERVDAWHGLLSDLYFEGPS